MVLMNFQFYNPNRKHLKKNLVLNSNWILDNSSLETIVSFAAVFKVVTQRSFPKGDKIGCELQNDVDTLWFTPKVILYKGRNCIDYQ